MVLLALVVPFLLLCSTTNGQTVWTDSFTRDITTNPNVDHAYTVNVKWDSVTNYLPTVNPQTTSHALQQIYGLWHFDSLVGSITPDSSTNYPFNATISGSPVYSATGGKFKGAFVFSGLSVADKIVLTTSPITNQMATGPGFAAAFWFKGGSTALPLVTGVLFEIEYSTFEVDYTTTGYMCTVRNAAGVFYRVSVPYPAGSYGQWTHIACSYNATALNLTLIINGQYSNSVAANLTAGTYFGDHALMGIGNRPYTTTSLSVAGIIDEFVFYGNAITIKDALYLYQALAGITPLPAPSFRSTLIVYNATANYWDFTPSWVVTNTSASIVVEISTNRGKTWCKAQPNVAFGLAQQCYLPASTLIYRVTYVVQASLDSITFTFKNTEPTRDWGKHVKVGINRSSYNYYSNTWMFVDIQKSAQSPGPTFAFNSNFYPTNANGTNRYTYLMAGTPTVAPSPANYTVFAQGEGQVECENSAAANGLPPGGKYRYIANVPQDLPIKCFNPWEASIYYSNPANPIRNLSYVLSGFEHNYTTAPFHPRYLSLFAGVSTQRFMDLGKTNGNNVVHFADRTLKTSVTQDLNVRSTVVNISAIVDAGTTPSNFSNTGWKVLVTTVGAHPFATGQSVTIMGSNSYISWTNTTGAAQPAIPLNGTWTVEVLAPTMFYVQYSDAHSSAFQPRSAGLNTAKLVSDNKGSAYSMVASGIALEHLIELATTMKSNAWFCIPTLAEDDFILKFAQLLYANMPTGTKAYIEFGNELWNTQFSQAVFAQRMGTALYGDTHAWIAARLAKIFKTFQDAFGSSMSSRIVKVLPAWAAGTSWGEGILKCLNTTTINPYNIKMDVLSIAPYFGGSVGSSIGGVAGLQFTITEDEVLDMVRDSLYTQIVPWVQANSALAKKYNLTLVAYEGGPGLVAPIWETGINYTNLTALLTGANSHPRMHDLVKQMFYIWYSNGGELFNYFSDMGTWSIYGSWGMLRNMTEDVTKSPKYQAFKEVLAIQNALTA